MDNRVTVEPYLATLSALALLRPPMHPVMMYARLLAILSHPHVSEGRFTSELHPIHQDTHAALVGDDVAGRTFQSGAVFL